MGASEGGPRAIATARLLKEYPMNYESPTERVTRLKNKLRDLVEDAKTVAVEADSSGWTRARNEKVEEIHRQVVDAKARIDDEEQGGELARSLREIAADI